METVPKNWFTFGEIALELGVPGNTLRRWAEIFPEFLPSRVEGRMRRFHEESLPTFRRIAGLYQDGKRTKEVAAILAREFAPVVDVAALTPAKAPGLEAGLPALIQGEISRALGESLAIIASQRRRLEAQGEELTRLRQVQEKQAEEFAELKKAVEKESAKRRGWFSWLRG